MKVEERQVAESGTETGATASPAPRRRQALIALLVLALIAAGLGLYFGLQKSTVKNKNTGIHLLATVAEFSGSGNTTTKSFKVQPGWQIQWQTQGQTFRVGLSQQKGFKTIVDQKGAGNGVTAPVGSGTFRLQITAKGSWSISVLS